MCNSISNYKAYRKKGDLLKIILFYRAIFPVIKNVIVHVGGEMKSKIKNKTNESDIRPDETTSFSKIKI